MAAVLAAAVLACAGAIGGPRGERPPDQTTAQQPSAHQQPPAEGLKPGVYEAFEPPSEDAAGPRDAAAAPEEPEVSEAAPRFVIQVAAFRDPDSARDLAALLRRHYPEYPAQVVPEGDLYRVWLGAWGTREEALGALELVRRRHPGAWIVAP